MCHVYSVTFHVYSVTCQICSSFVHFHDVDIVYYYALLCTRIYCHCQHCLQCIQDS